MPHVHSAAAGHRKRLVAVFCLTLGIFFFEVIGGYLSNSLALLADAGGIQYVQEQEFPAGYFAFERSL